MTRRTSDWLLAAVLAVLAAVWHMGAGPAVPGAAAPPHGRLAAAVAGEGARQLEVHVLAVGDGEAVLVRCGEGAALVGAGPAWAGHLVAGHAAGSGVTRLDAVILLHPARRHVGGVPGLLERLHVDAVYDAAGPLDGEAYRRALVALADAGAFYHRLSAGGRVAVGCAEVRALTPVDAAPEETGAAVSGWGGTLLIEHQGLRVLLAGDMDGDADRTLVRLYPDLRSDVLVVARGGHKDGTSRLFLEVVRPAVAVIPVAGYNEEGRPHPEVLARLAAAGTRVYRTDRDGTVILRAGPQGFRIRLQSPLTP